MNTTIDTAVIFVFSAFVLGIGLLFARTGRNLKSFFAGGEAVPWFIGGLSLFMSFFSAGTFVAWGSIAYQHGWVAVTIQWTMCLGGLVTGLYLAPRWKATSTASTRWGSCWPSPSTTSATSLAMCIQPGIALFGVENLRNGVGRPTCRPNAWVAAPGDARPAVTLTWPGPKRIRRVELSFDTDWDHPMETVLMGHPETAMPFCVRAYALCNDRNERVYHRADNHQTRNTIGFEKPLETTRLVIHLEATHGGTPASLSEVRCYE